jgi:hypothetical protein
MFVFGTRARLGGTIRSTGLSIGGHVGADHGRIQASGAQREAASMTTIWRFGPFLTWYPDPSDGLHVGLLAGLGVMAETSALGRAASLGFWAVESGYEWWISEQWSLGASMMVGGLGQEAPLEESRGRLSAEVYAVALTATYN